MKLYLAGPMSGIPYYNWPEFDRWASLLREDGHEVINPADLDREAGFVPCPKGTPLGEEAWRECMARDLPHVCRAQGIALMPGWTGSRGARLELDVAEALNLASFRLVGPHNLSDMKPRGYIKNDQLGTIIEGKEKSE